MKKLLVILVMVFSLSCAAFSVETWATAPHAKDGSDIQTLRHQMRLVLQDKRFDYPDHFAWWNRFWDRIGRILDRQLARWRPAKVSSFDRLINRAINYLGLFLLILAPFALVYFLPRIFGKEARLRRKSTGQAPEIPAETGLLAKAKFQADRGNIPEAIRLVYLAGLDHLRKRGVLQNGGSLSDKEYAAILRRRCGAENHSYLAFTKLVRLFQEKWYGCKPCQPSDYNDALNWEQIICADARFENAGANQTDVKP